MSNKIVFCNNCHYVGKAKMKGSVGILVLLLLFGVLPGLIYAVIVSMGNTSVCSQCGSNNTLPYYSPRAKELMKKHGVEFDDIDVSFLLDEKKPFHKRWWVWALAFFFFYMVLISLSI